MDGDPGLRGRRRRLARAWRGDAPELIAGATLAVVGSGGLVVVLGGGPAPGRPTVRSAAAGATGEVLRRGLARAQVATIEDDALARRLAPLAAAPGARITPELAAALAEVWPARGASV
jgi:flagellar biosynthetic protein FlhB